MVIIVINLFEDIHVLGASFAINCKDARCGFAAHVWRRRSQANTPPAQDVADHGRFIDPPFVGGRPAVAIECDEVPAGATSIKRKWSPEWLPAWRSHGNHVATTGDHSSNHWQPLWRPLWQPLVRALHKKIVCIYVDYLPT